MCSKTENQHSQFKGNLKDAPQEHAWPTHYKCSSGACMAKLNWCMWTLHYDILGLAGLWIYQRNQEKVIPTHIHLDVHHFSLQ